MTKRMTGKFSIIGLVVYGLSFQSTHLCGQTIKPDSLRLYCTVVDSSDNAPIALAAVEVLNEQMERETLGQTNERGECAIPLAGKRPYFIRINYLGYETLLLHLAPVDETSLQLFLRLKTSAQMLEGVTIRAARPVFRQEPGKLVMTVANTILAEGSNMLEVLQKSPGVALNMDGSLTFRGKQGLLVLVDNKNLYLSGDELSRYLESIPGSEVEKIEIISNPSARFDASGNVGIINIVTNRPKEKRLNGTAQVLASYGNYFRPGASLQLNARPRPNLGLYGSYNLSGGNSLTINNSDRTVLSNEKPFLFAQTGDRVSNRLDNRLKFGLDYDKGRHTLGFLVNGFHNVSNFDNDSRTEIRAPQLDSVIAFSNKGESRWSSFSGNGNYQLRIDSTGKLLDVNVDFATFHYDGTDNMRSRFLLPDGGPIRADEVFRNISPSQVNIAAGKFDYTHPFKPGHYIQTGAKYSRASTDNDLIFEISPNGSWERDPRRSNHFIFDEDISAAYVDYYNRFGKSWDYGVGIRTEYSVSKGNNVTIDSLFTRKIFQWFPSGYIRKTFAKQAFTLSYIKRIDRPDYNSLNPFVFYIDNYSFWRGNTQLKPQLVHTIDLAHMYNQRWFSSMYYTYTDNVFMQLPVQDDETKAVYNTVQNIGTSNYWGASISYYASLKPWWYLAATVSGSYTKVSDKRAQALANQGVEGGQGYFYTYNGFTLPKQFRCEVTLVANTPNRSFWYVKGYAVLGLGLSKAISNSTITLNINDVFNQTRYRSSIDYQNLNISSYYKPETRYLRLTYSWRFGNNQLQQQRERPTGVEDELKRVKN